jgi:hypothetical protein
VVHTQGFDGEDELIIGIRDHAVKPNVSIRENSGAMAHISSPTVVEHSFDAFL